RVNASPNLIHLSHHSQHVLYVVSNFVGDHVGLGEVARRIQFSRQLIEEAQIQVDPLIGRAVERAHGRLTGTAGSASEVGKQHQGGRRVSAATGSLKQGLPCVLGIGKDFGSEL